MALRAALEPARSIAETPATQSFGRPDQSLTAPRGRLKAYVLWGKVTGYGQRCCPLAGGPVTGGTCQYMEEGQISAAERLLVTVPADDVGAATADRFYWQAMMATADVLAMYFDALESDGSLRAGADFVVLCEHHEDWAIIRGSDAEIVSGKHREASAPPFASMRQLLLDGGALHLYQRWVALSRSPSCRLVTTSGLTDMSAKMGRVCERLRSDESATNDEIVEVISRFRSSVASALTIDGVVPTQESEQDVRGFLASLRLQVGEPRRDQVPDLAAHRYGAHVAARLGAPDAPDAIWRAVLALVTPRMRAAGERVGGHLPTPLDIVHDQPLAARRLTLQDVDVAVRFALRHADSYQPLPRLVMASPMAVKMVEGGCSDNAIERADHLRLQYRRYWRARRGQPSVVDQRRMLTDTLSRVVDEVTDDVRIHGTAWGSALWRALDLRFREMDGTPEAHGLSADLMLGGVSELANHCRAWYSDRFDAKGALARLIADSEADVR